jgi:predicted N-acyltransferase
LDYRFLRALEESGCVGEDTGWSPIYLTFGEPTATAGLAAYIKTHSYGEYIFDWAWADAAVRMGYDYYPKLVVGAPFSPVAGPRFLGDADSALVRDALVSGLEQISQQIKASSIHVLFPTQHESNWLGERSFIERETFQFQWFNEDYGSFDDFLQRFRSKRRNQIKRERKRARSDGVTLRALMGADISRADIEQMYAFYTRTVQLLYRGQKYLNLDFFIRLFETMPEKICLVQALHDGEVVAGTLNLVSDGVFYGRYWGCSKDIRDLHFEVCCYYPVELAIERGWQRVELGAGGQHKWGRGFLPQLTYSAHKLYIDALVEPVRAAVAKESRHLRKEIEHLKSEILKP